MMFRKKSNDEKVIDDTTQVDSISVASSSLVTDLSASDYKCLCSHLPKTIETPSIVALESGIGSSICSLDNHLHIEHAHETISASNAHMKYDCHDLPPVTEEEDSDGLINIINCQKEDVSLLNSLPWRDTSSISCNLSTKNRNANKQQIFDAVDESLADKIDAMQLCTNWWDCSKNINQDDPTSTNAHEVNQEYENHLPNPWCTHSNNNFLPVLSTMCRERDVSPTMRSELCFSHNMQHEQECRNANFVNCGRRHSLHTSTTSYRTHHICWENQRAANIIEEDENQLLSTATERVLEWLKLYEISHHQPAQICYESALDQSALIRTFKNCFSDGDNDAAADRNNQ